VGVDGGAVVEEEADDAVDGDPVLLTSNKAFSDWGQVFAGDPVMASAALDRLIHRCTVVNIRGDSYRLKEKRAAGTGKDEEPKPA
jgi:hypothetical protein